MRVWLRCPCLRPRPEPGWRPWQADAPVPRACAHLTAPFRRSWQTLGARAGPGHLNDDDSFRGCTVSSSQAGCARRGSAHAAQARRARIIAWAPTLL